MNQFYSRLLCCSLFLSLFAFSTQAILAQERVSTSVMSYNIHLQNSGEEAVEWDRRRSNVAQVIRLRKPEILGIQGASFEQSDWLSKNLSTYTAHTPNATETEIGQDICPIFYNSSKYRALDQGSIALSNGLDEVLLNWIKLERIDQGHIVYVFNTHVEEQMGTESTLLADLEKHISSIAGEDTYVFLGDMGHAPESTFIQGMTNWMKDSLASCLVNISEKEDTNYGWKVSNDGERTDYVFLSMDIAANSYEVLDTSFRDDYPSDHLPVFSRLRLEANPGVSVGTPENSGQ